MSVRELFSPGTTVINPAYLPTATLGGVESVTQGSGIIVTGTTNVIVSAVPPVPTLYSSSVSSFPVTPVYYDGQILDTMPDGTANELIKFDTNAVAPFSAFPIPASILVGIAANNYEFLDVWGPINFLSTGAAGNQSANIAVDCMASSGTARSDRFNYILPPALMSGFIASVSGGPTTTDVGLVYPVGGQLIGLPTTFHFTLSKTLGNFTAAATTVNFNLYNIATAASATIGVGTSSTQTSPLVLFFKLYN